MSVNQSDNNLETRLFTEIDKLRTEILQLRTKQIIGADTIKMDSVATKTIGPITLPAGAHLAAGVLITPFVPTLTLYNFEVAAYIDGTTAADVFPYGANITGGKLRLVFSNWLDFEQSIDRPTGVRKYEITLFNNDTVAHDITFKYSYINIALPAR